MILNLNKKFKNVDGSEMEENSMGRILANALAGIKSKNIDSIKAMGWCDKLYHGNAIEIDLSDLNNLEKFVREEGNFTPLADAQLRIALMNCKSESEKKEEA